MSHDVVIRVNIDSEGPPCVLEIKEESGLGGGRRQHTGRRNRDFFRWRSHSGALTIEFPHGHPFTTDPNTTVPANQHTRRVQIDSTKPPATYKYNVSILEPNGNVCFEDPEVIVDDISTREGDVLREATLVAASTIEQLVTHSFANLENSSLKLRSQEGLFFPNGIREIKIQVTAGPVTLSLEVSGPNTKS